MNISELLAERTQLLDSVVILKQVIEFLGENLPGDAGDPDKVLTRPDGSKVEQSAIEYVIDVLGTTIDRFEQRVAEIDGVEVTVPKRVGSKHGDD